MMTVVAIIIAFAWGGTMGFHGAGGAEYHQGVKSGRGAAA